MDIATAITTTPSVRAMSLLSSPDAREADQHGRHFGGRDDGAVVDEAEPAGEFKQAYGGNNDNKPDDADTAHAGPAPE